MERLAMMAMPPHGADGDTISARFTARVQDGAQVVRFSRSDVLDPTYIEQVGDDIYRHLKPVPEPRVVVDLENVHALSSMALGMLIQLRKVVTERGGKVCIANASPDVVKIFKVIRLNKLISLHDTTADAVASAVR